MNKPGYEGNHLVTPIFVVGYMHSGTTMLRKIIGGHPSVFSIRAETMFFDQLKIMTPHRFPNLSDDDIFDKYVNFLIWMTTFDRPPITASESQFEPQPFEVSQDLRYQIIQTAKQNREYTSVFSCVYRMIAEAAGKSFWLEKTPDHIFHIDTIIDSLPDVRFFEIVRDPRDILVSKKVRKQTNWTERFGEEVSARMQRSRGFDPLRDSLGWKAAVQAGSDAAERHPNRIYRLRYEDLVSQPEIEAPKLCEFLGVNFDPAMLNIGSSNRTVIPDAGHAKGIDQRAVGKWRRSLPPDVISLCQMINGKKMEKLGYERFDTSFGSRIKMFWWPLRSIIDFFSRFFGVWQRHGTKGVQSRLKNYWLRVGHFLKK